MQLGDDQFLDSGDRKVEILVRDKQELPQLFLAPKGQKEFLKEFLRVPKS